MKQKQVKTTSKAVKKGKVEKKTAPPKRVMDVVEESDDEEEILVEKVVSKKPGSKKVSKVRKGVEVDETPVDDASEDEEKVVSQKTGNKKATKGKKGKVQKASEEDEENDSEDEQTFVSKKHGNTKATKVQKVEVEETSEDEEASEDEESAPKNEEEEDDQEMDEDQEVEDEDECDAVEDEDVYDEEHKEAEEEDEEDEDEDDNDEEEEEDENETVSDSALEKEQPTIPSKIKGGEIPDSVDPSTIVHITKLPKGCKQVDIVEALAKYGAIDQIHIVAAQHSTHANVAFKTQKGANAALLGANRKVKINGSRINVYSYKKKERFDKMQPEYAVYVRNFKPDTTKEQFEKHFEDCGKVENIKLVIKPRNPYGFIRFSDKSGAAAAIKLHNSVLNGLNIEVRPYTDESPMFEDIFDEKRTVVAKNVQHFNNIDAAKFESIFAKCGEILNLCIVCKGTLAFITFKTEEAAQKALQLNGKTEKGFELDLYLHTPTTKKTTIYVTNLPKDCTEEDLKKCFSRAGEIGSINHKGPFAIIRFLDSDGYCKSFLYNESFINKQMIFVEPLSIRKKFMTAKKISKLSKKGLKRPAQNGNSVFKPKKQKVTK